MLDYRIETFITLCKERNYSKTAQKLCITQPAVTQHIQYLERHYNCKLFEYENKQLRLTKQGMILERLALGLSASTNRFKALLKELEEKEKTFTFGVSSTVSEYMMPSVITSLLARDRNVTLNIHVESGQKMITDLRNGDLECAFIEGNFEQPELMYHKFTTEEYILVANRPIESGSIDDLLQETLITREPGASCHDLLSAQLGKLGKTIQDFNNQVYTNNVNLIKQLLINGAGIGLVYKLSVQKELEDNVLYQIPVDMNLFQDFYFVMLRDNIFAKDYEEFYEYACDVYKEHRRLTEEKKL